MLMLILILLVLVLVIIIESKIMARSYDAALQRTSRLR
jgi:hypothetical protein